MNRGAFDKRHAYRKNGHFCGPSGKVGYESRKRARQASVKILRQRGDNYSLSPYKCPQCDCWHLTSKGDKHHTKAALVIRCILWLIGQSREGEDAKALCRRIAMFAPNRQMTKFILHCERGL